MAFVAVQRITLVGLTPVMSPATVTVGDTFTPGPDIFLYVNNAHTAPITATLVVPGSTPVGEPDPDVARTITNATVKFIGPIDTTEFTDPATGLATVTWSVVTNITFAVIQF